MFVAVARLVLQIPESGSLKAKRQVVRRVTDRLKARFNVAVAEVGDNDLWQKATLGLAVVGNDRRHVNEQMEKIIHAVEEMYVAPLMSREMELLALGDRLYSTAEVPTLAAAEAARAGAGVTVDEAFDLATLLAQGERSMAEAEGMGTWEERHGARPESERTASREGPKELTLDEARARARALRNPREWEKP
ncbi:MAG: DUF503 domain-containing protein [Myxococcaceae bacterium]|nr:DUF503 domain-containing protein [Myxococcaceae bacterium]